MIKVKEKSTGNKSMGKFGKIGGKSIGKIKGKKYGKIWKN